MDGLAGGLFLGGLEPLPKLVMLRLPAGAARGDRSGVGLLLAKRFNKEMQDERRVAFEILTGARDLIDQRVLERIASDRHDLCVLRRVARRIPGRLVLDEEREIHFCEIRICIQPEIEVVRLREIRKARARRVDHGDRKKFGEFDECVERLLVRPCALDQNKRRARLQEFGCDLLRCHRLMAVWTAAARPCASHRASTIPRSWIPSTTQR